MRYYKEDIPFFEGALLSELAEKEFCYNPVKLISFNEYTRVYYSSWDLAIEEILLSIL